jgi:hypothetical protein
MINVSLNVSLTQENSKNMSEAAESNKGMRYRKIDKLFESVDYVGNKSRQLCADTAVYGVGGGGGQTEVPCVTQGSVYGNVKMTIRRPLLMEYTDLWRSRAALRLFRYEGAHTQTVLTSHFVLFSLDLRT